VNSAIVGKVMGWGQFGLQLFGSVASQGLPHTAIGWVGARRLARKWPWACTRHRPPMVCGKGDPYAYWRAQGRPEEIPAGLVTSWGPVRGAWGFLFGFLAAGIDAGRNRALPVKKVGARLHVRCDRATPVPKALHHPDDGHG